MRRREMLVWLGAGTFSPRSVLAQSPQPRTAIPGKTYRLAVAHPTLPASAIGDKSPLYEATFIALRALGYVPGQNLVVEPHSAEGYPERFADVARAVVRTAPDAIHATVNLLVHALQNETSTIPIVGAIGDPIAIGTTKSLSRPGGNFTGVTTETGLAFWGKRFQILRDLIPGLSRAAYFSTRQEWAMRFVQARRELFESSGGVLSGGWIDNWTEAEARRGLQALVDTRPEGVVVTDNGGVLPRIGLVRETLAQHGIPAIYAWPGVARFGGLVGYGAEVSEWGRDTAQRIHMVLNGVPAGEIPIAQPAKYELVINLKTARTIGLKVAPSLLAIADEVIE